MPLRKTKITMVKINAQVDQETRESIRDLAGEHGSNVQIVTNACIALGLTKLVAMSKKSRSEILPPDPRRAKHT